MSASEASPHTRSGIGIGTVARLLLIPLGIMSALVLARDGLGFPLIEFFNAIVQVYDDTLGDIALVVFEPFIHTVFAYLRETFAWDLQLYPHWKHVFVLLWLMLGRFALLTKRLPDKIVIGTLAMIFAFVGAALAGMWPPTSPRIFAAFMSGTMMFFAVLLIVGAARGRVATGGMFWILLGTAVIFLAGAIGLTEGEGLDMSSMFPSLTNGGLVAGTFMVAVLGFVSMIYALVRGAPATVTFHDRLNSAQFRLGLEILTVLGGAAVIVAISRYVLGA